MAPLWAGLTALINQIAPEPIGFFLPMLYQNPQVMRDITQGNTPRAELIFALNDIVVWRYRRCSDLRSQMWLRLKRAMMSEDGTALLPPRRRPGFTFAMHTGRGACPSCKTK